MRIRNAFSLDLMNRTGLIALTAIAILMQGCALTALIGNYNNPQTPEIREGQQIELPGLRGPATIVERTDGLWRIEAQNEHDAMMATGYLQARDRLFQMDLLRHLAQGRLAELVGDRNFGNKKAVEVDFFNRFMGFGARANAMVTATSEAEQIAVQAFVEGVNHWIDHESKDMPTLEHRLLGIDEVRPWTAMDSLSIYQFLMYSLSGNWSVEARRLWMACQTDIRTTMNVWPYRQKLGEKAMPSETISTETHPIASASPEGMDQKLRELCPDAQMHAKQQVRDNNARPDEMPQLTALLELLHNGIYASNNWAIAPQKTSTGGAILSDDPHLPHMSPPIVWGMHQKFKHQGEEQSIVGFALPGVHRVVFGHNHHVAWGATTNYLDRQDLALLDVSDHNSDQYKVDSNTQKFTKRTETFKVRGSDSVRHSARFTPRGIVLNDIETTIGDWIPLVALWVASPGPLHDIDAARGMNYARNAGQLAEATQMMTSGCINWLYADTQGNIGYRSPCMVPVRPHHNGSFPVPGWDSKYFWQEYIALDSLPASDIPQRGWLATANNPLVPAESYPTTLWGDPAPPNRFNRIAHRLQQSNQFDAKSAAQIQTDTYSGTWQRLKLRTGGAKTPNAKDKPMKFCRTGMSEPEMVSQMRATMCAWNGHMDDDSIEATLSVLMTSYILDHTLLSHLDASAEQVKWFHNISKFEGPTQRIFAAPATSALWDNAHTPDVREDRGDILSGALHYAIEEASDRYGSDPEKWKWGIAHPLTLHHPFAGKPGVISALINPAPVPGVGGPVTVFKNQFFRGDREDYKVQIGPVVRITVDMSQPEKGTFSLAGGNSGWPGSPRYGNLIGKWRYGQELPLTPEQDDGVHATLTP